MKYSSLMFGVILTLVGEPALGASLTTLINSGSSSNRVDVVFLGDGYTSMDLTTGTYDNHINSYINYFFSNSLNTDPFYRYHNYFNIHKIDVVSNESGADVPSKGIFRDTALDATYSFDGVTERLLYINSSKANTVRNAALATAQFTAEMQFVTVNDARYGGGGGAYAVFAGGNASASEIALHEVAHAFSNLADEYGGNPNLYAGAEPIGVNVTKDATGNKWARWLGYNQSGVGAIGAYEGGSYYDMGLYRPSGNSKMRSLNRPFDAVSREKIILDIYNLVNPLDSWLDNTTLLFDADQLFVKPIDKSVINLEWFVDGTLIPLATEEVFSLSNFGYGPGRYTVTARAFDPMGFNPVSGWVRMNQSNLEQFISWDVAITDTAAAPEPTTIGGLAIAGISLLSAKRRRRSP